MPPYLLFIIPSFVLECMTMTPGYGPLQTRSRFVTDITVALQVRKAEIHLFRFDASRYGTGTIKAVEI